MKSIQFVSSIISISWVIDWIGLIEGADCPAHQLPFQSQQQLQSILQSRWWIKQILVDRLSSVKVDNVFEFDDDFKWTIITGMFQLNVVETVYGQVKCVTQAFVYAKQPADDASFSLPIIRENNHRILERSSAVTNRRRFLTPRFNRPFAAQKQITRQQIWGRWSEPPWYFIINQLVFFQGGALVARRMRRHWCDPILYAVAYEFSKRVSFRNAVTPSPFT